MAATTGLPLLADQPLSPPSDHRVYSPNKRFYVFLDAKKKWTTAYQATNKAELWDMSGWYRVAALADDGEHFITGYDGRNLIPVNYDPKMTMLAFHRNGVLFHSISLSELVPDLSKLQRTASHFYWGYYAGLEAGLYRVETVDRGVLFFDPKTGKQSRKR